MEAFAFGAGIVVGAGAVALLWAGWHEFGQPVTKPRPDPTPWFDPVALEAATTRPYRQREYDEDRIYGLPALMEITRLESDNDGWLDLDEQN